jgi:hypothetical protein
LAPFLDDLIRGIVHTVRREIHLSRIGMRNGDNGGWFAFGVDDDLVRPSAARRPCNL